MGKIDGTKRKQQKALSSKVSSLPYVLLEHRADVPRRVEDVEASAEALVVNGPRVDGEQSHQQDQIPPSKHHPPDLKHTDGFHFTASPNGSQTRLSSFDLKKIFGIKQ